MADYDHHRIHCHLRGGQGSEREGERERERLKENEGEVKLLKAVYLR